MQFKTAVIALFVAVVAASADNTTPTASKTIDKLSPLPEGWQREIHPDGTVSSWGPTPPELIREDAGANSKILNTTPKDGGKLKKRSLQECWDHGAPSDQVRRDYYNNCERLYWNIVNRQGANYFLSPQQTRYEEYGTCRLVVRNQSTCNLKNPGYSGLANLIHDIRQCPTQSGWAIFDNDRLLVGILIMNWEAPPAYSPRC